MPTGPLPPSDDYLGDGDRTTGEFQAELNNLQNWARQFQAQLDALSSTTPGEAFNRAVGDSAGQLTARGVGAAGTELVDNDRLDDEIDTRIGTTGNLGSAAVESYSDSGLINLGGDFGASEQIRCVRIGRVVVISSETPLGHISSSSPRSSAGVIPSEFRPTVGANMFNVCLLTLNYIVEGVVLTDGTFGLNYNNYDGTSRNEVSSTNAPSMSYVII